MAEGHSLPVEVKVLGAREFTAAWGQIHQAAKLALSEMRREASTVPTALKSIDAAVRDLSARAAGLAQTLGPLGSALSMLGPSGLVMGAAIAGVTTLTRSAISMADALEDQAQAVDVSVRKLQELQAAGLLVGVSHDKMAAALERFAANVGAARSGSGSLFEALKGIDRGLADVLRTTPGVEAALRLVVDTMGRLPTTADKAALAAAAFGRGAAKLVPALADAGHEARNLGLVIEDRLVKQGAAASDALDLLGVTLRQNLSAALLGLAPLIESTARSLTTLLGEVAAFDRWRYGLGESSSQAAVRQQSLRVEELAERLRVRVTPQGTDPSSERFRQRTAAMQAELDAEIRKLQELETAERRAAETAAETRRTEEAAARKAIADANAKREAMEAGDKAAKEQAQSRAQALQRITELEQDAAIAGLDGIARIEQARENAYADWAALAEKAGLREEEAARGYLAIWERAEREKAETLAEADRKASEKAGKEAARAAQEFARPFEHMVENIQRGVGDIFTALLEDGADAFDDLGTYARRMFARLGGEIAELLFTRAVVQPILAQLGGGGQAPAGGGPGALGYVNTAGSVLGGVAELGRLVGLGGSSGVGWNLGTFAQGAGGILGIVNALAGRGSTFSRVSSGVLGANAVANIAGYGVSIVPTASIVQGPGITGITIMAGGQHVATLGASGGASAGSSAAAAASGSNAASMLGTVSAAAPYIAAAIGAYLVAQNSYDFERKLATVGRGGPVGRGGLAYVTDLQAQRYALDRGLTGLTAGAFIDPVSTTIFRSTIEPLLARFGIDLFGLDPTKGELLAGYRGGLAERLNTFASGRQPFTATGGLGRAGRAAAAGLRDDGTYFLAEIVARVLDRSVLNAPGNPGLREYPDSVSAATRDILRSGLARHAAQGGDAGELVARLVRAFVGFAPALRAVNQAFLEAHGTTLKAGKSQEDFARRAALVIDVFQRRLPAAMDATAVAGAVLADQGYLSHAAIVREAALSSREAAEVSGDLTLPGGRRGLRRLRRGPRRGLRGAEAAFFAALDANDRAMLALEGGSAITATHAFGDVQSATDALFGLRGKALRTAPDVAAQAVEAVGQFGQALLGVVTELRQLGEQAEETRLALAAEQDVLRQTTTAEAIRNELIAANASRYEAVRARGGSPAALSSLVERQMGLLRAQAQATLDRTATRMGEIAPLAGLATGLGDQLDAIAFAQLPTPARQLAALQQRLQAAQTAFRGATSGEERARSAQRVSALAADLLEAGGGMYGLGSARGRGVLGAGTAAIEEVRAAAEAAERERLDLLALQKTTQRQLADALAYWGGKLAPLIEQRMTGLTAYLRQYFTPAEIASALADPQAAQMLVATRQADLLTDIRGTLAEMLAVMAGRPRPVTTLMGPPPEVPALAAGGVVTRPTLALIGERGPEAVVPLSRVTPRAPIHVHVTVAAPPTGTSDATLALYARTVGDAIGARVAHELDRGPAGRRFRKVA